ncbi:hypothetical protein [Nocardia stercoris]|uniref:Uncharacterized protein n=1 Tax=Nocardia stercoris TaxID=2483361 RepID=A0A3M2LF01_9NOCA|nr:hypothetical protein [Nocardia stercoris]RMI35380.1 hypothetical protein EBN03_03670 [Nocardia stercoris]
MRTAEPLRHKDTGLILAHFAARILVVCPECGGRAVDRHRPGVEEPRFPGQYYSSPRRVICSCGYARDVDRLPCPCCAPQPRLWLRTRCAGRILWAYNEEHIDELTRFVAATLREDHRRYHRSMPSCLPTWMKRAANRTEVLNGLARLRLLAADHSPSNRAD